MQKKYFECQCESSDHVVRFVYDEDDLWIEVQLNQYRNFWKRLWVGIKYIFGYTCKFGHWDCTMIKKEDKQGLIDLIRESSNNV